MKYGDVGINKLNKFLTQLANLLVFIDFFSTNYCEKFTQNAVPLLRLWVIIVTGCYHAVEVPQRDQIILSVPAIPLNVELVYVALHI
jgi:hypothetical protein